VVTAQQQAEHQAAQTAILTLAVDELLDNLAGIENLSAERAAALARDVIADLAGIYGDEAASLNADWYDEVRAEVAAALALEYAAQMADPIPADDIQEDIGWALAPLFAPETGEVPDYESAIGRLAGKLQFFVGEMGRRGPRRHHLRPPRLRERLRVLPPHGHPRRHVPDERVRRVRHRRDRPPHP
jgi:hypothetical protein